MSPFYASRSASPTSRPASPFPKMHKPPAYFLSTATASTIPQPSTLPRRQIRYTTPTSQISQISLTTPPGAPRPVYTSSTRSGLLRPHTRTKDKTPDTLVKSTSLSSMTSDVDGSASPKRLDSRTKFPVLSPPQTPIESESKRTNFYSNPVILPPCDPANEIREVAMVSITEGAPLPRKQRGVALSTTRDKRMSRFFSFLILFSLHALLALSLIYGMFNSEVLTTERKYPALVKIGKGGEFAVCKVSTTLIEEANVDVSLRGDKATILQSSKTAVGSTSIPQGPASENTFTSEKSELDITEIVEQ